ncbi:MAG: outer membrane protein assembly factor BamA [Acidobacteria bacterium]|nr:outer membrane protein assembly factor BamA [Acidobacteriota bacterium]
MDGTGGFFRWVFKTVCPQCVRRCRSLLAFFGIIGVLSLSPAVGESLQQDNSDESLFSSTVRSIEYSADFHFDRSHYDPYIGIQPGDRLTRTALKRSIQSLYDSGRFSSIVVQALPGEDGTCLRFELKQNYYFNEFSLEGDADLKGRSLWEWVPLPVGKRYTEESLEEARQAVQNFIQERGYYLAEIRAVTLWNETNRQVNVVFEVQPGELAVIGSIDILGVPDRDYSKLSDKFGYKKGKEYDRSRLADRRENLRKHFTKEGYLAAEAEVTESFNPETGSVALTLKVSNYGKVRVVVDGYKIDKNQLRRLLPVLTGEGVREEILDEGADNLKEFLENRGHSEAEVAISEEEEEGVRVLRYRIVPGRKFKVEYVRFQGNKVISDKELFESVEVRPSSLLNNSTYSVTRLDDDVAALKALYESRGYLEADIIPLIEPLEDESDLGIKYQCTEGPLSTTGSVSFEGNTAFATEELLSRIILSPGKAYSPILAERDRQALLAAYNDVGYLQVRGTVRAEKVGEENSYHVGFQIEEGTQFFVDRIIILGNDHTRGSVIEKHIKLKPGDPLSLGKLLQTQQALYRIGIFDQVRVVQQNPESTNPYHNVVVRLRESKRFTIRYGIGYQEREKLRGTLEFSDINILGMARRADIRLRGSSIEQYVTFNLQQTQYRPLPVDTYVSLSASYRQEVSFDIRRLGATYQFSHPLSNHSWGLLRYNFQNVRSFNLQISDPEFEREDTPRNLSTFSVLYVNDSRDNYLDPSEGFFTSTDFSITPKPLGDNSYISFFTQNNYYGKLPKSLMTAASLRIGLIQPYNNSSVPISERFFAGGSSSLRGFETDYAGPLDPVTFKPTGGNALVIGSVELRRPILSFIHIAGFYDTGNVFSTIRDISFSGFSHSIGAGLRFKTPLGPLRIDYGYNLNLPPELRNPEPPREGLDRGYLFITVGPPF